MKQGAGCDEESAYLAGSSYLGNEGMRYKILP